MEKAALEKRKFTNEFKESVARRVEQGTPVKTVARDYKIDPAVVRQWRDALRDLGPDAFLRSGKRKFTKEFKEAAVRRVDEGIPVKEVARACRVHPFKLRQWRDALRDFGTNAFLEKERRTRAVIFRLTEYEHNRLKVIAKASGARSLSDFARSRLLNQTGPHSVGATRQKAAQRASRPAPR
jgi:transposase-like protein